ncbi:hypothetical protein R3P38DRAFT_38861 [Favolaschia claudopus]|uniref:Uncharacterized protein n=1 Tax=Favolaschia claudopus TaxID=2862362 RepID=A0AAW0EIH7_9AGAR
MTLWNVLAPLNPGQWLPQAPVTPRTRKHGASKRPRSCKPGHLVTPFQKYKKKERAVAVPAPTSPPTPSEEVDPAPNGVFEPETELPEERIRIQMEFAKMRIRPQARPRENIFDDPVVRRRLELQRIHDEASLALLPTQAPPIFYSKPLALAPSSFPAAPVRRPSLIVQKWNDIRKDVDAERLDREALALIRRKATAKRVRPVKELRRLDAR